jgi:hypothetical protein
LFKPGEVVKVNRLMDATTVWKDFFRNWPADVDRRGILVTNYDEQIPFDGFLTSETMVLVERRAPDTVGARKVLLPFQNIMAIKITDVVKAKSFQAAGFEDARPRK